MDGRERLSFWCGLLEEAAARVLELARQEATGAPEWAEALSALGSRLESLKTVRWQTGETGARLTARDRERVEDYSAEELAAALRVCDAAAAFVGEGRPGTPEYRWLVYMLRAFRAETARRQEEVKP